MPVTDYLPGDFVHHRSPPASLEEANLYCETLAKTHYENFSVVTFLLPRDKRQDFYNIYSYCRWSDDLSDEVDDTAKSLELLDWWESELEKCYAGKPEHVVYAALEKTIQKYNIPITPFRNLLIAFRQDQTIKRHETFDDLLGYCKNSANPVGHLVLYLCGYSDTERQGLSDYTCTALQLTNFWQDIVIDLKKDRIYLPLEDMRKYGYSETELFKHTYNEPFQEMMRFEVTRTREFFKKGLELFPMVDKAVRPDVELFSRGGIEILNRIEENQYDIFKHRPSLSKMDKMKLAAKRIMRI